MAKYSFLKEVKKSLVPDKTFIKEVEVFIKELNKILKGENIVAECVKGGSVAKGTLIKDDHDVDLFVRFEYDKYKDQKISNILEKSLKKFKPERVHGSRDYFQIKKNKMTYELVPVLKIDDYSRAENVTDMSPLHVDWVKKHTTKSKLDEIRLLKQFCKANELYGAESYIGGFSGHIIDIITIHYGSFLNVLEEVRNWGAKETIDPEQHLLDPFNDLNSSKVMSPLIIVDPVQPDRNAAAALSKEKFELFKIKANEFLESPSQDYFIKKQFKIADVKKQKKEDETLFIVEAEALEGKTDVIGAKLLKTHNHITRELKDNDFKVEDYGWNFDKEKKAVFYYFVKSKKLSDEIEQRGPPVDSVVDSAKFKNKHETITIRNGRMYAKVKRKYTTPNKLIEDLIKSEYVKERTKKVKKEMVK
ncbi:CCA tRNA nucleotidyltransferase [archaeon D22]|nr:CCA tRNA nucleotidyltransferase [archaeon D22]